MSSPKQELPSLDDKVATLRHAFGLDATASVNEVIAHAMQDAMLASEVPEGCRPEMAVDALMTARSMWQEAGLR